MKLSDGLCSSACALFLEMMHHQAGVKTVAAGGLPSNGPMQTPSGSRGAQAYTFDNINTDIGIAKATNASAGNFLPERQVDFFIADASFNIRDQVRKGESTPLQFVYEAANCRIFYTKDTVYNFGNLWRYAANAIWTKPELCVQGSTGIASNGNSSDISGPPTGLPSLNPNIRYNMTTILQLSGAVHEVYPDFSTQQFDHSVTFPNKEGASCVRRVDGGNGCEGRLTCQKFKICQTTQSKCARACDDSRKPTCPCIYTHTHEASSERPKRWRSGYCNLASPCGAHVNPDAPLPIQRR